MISDLKTYLMAFIQLIQTNPKRKGLDFHFELGDLNYTLAGLKAIYDDKVNHKRYQVTISELPPNNYNDPFYQLPGKL